MATVTNLQQWIDDNTKYFLPPVCNKMLHGDGQLKIFFIGGPNIRKDFHLEEGEELFYQRKGDMNLIVLERNKFRTIPIKEGEVFLLPGKIPHSPQRYEGTVGFVVERNREKNPEEKDCLRYYMEGTTDSLYERWFYCEDLGTQLGPIIQEFFRSEEYRTGRRVPGSSLPKPFFHPDSHRITEDPLPLNDWIDANRQEIDVLGCKRLWSTEYQSDIMVLGCGDSSDLCDRGEIWLLQLAGSCKVTVGGTAHTLEADHSLLVPVNTKCRTERGEGSLTLYVRMNPANKKRAFKHLD